MSPRLTRSALSRSFRRSMVIGVLLAVSMALGARALAGTVAKGADVAALAALGLSLPLYAVSLVPVAVLQRAMEFSVLARVNAAANIGSAGVALAAGFAGAGTWALVTRQLLWFGLLAAVSAALARPHLAGALRGVANAGRPQRAFSDRWFLLFGVTSLVALNLDYLVIGAVGNVSAVGLYALAFLIAFAPMQHFSSEVGKVLFAAAAASDRGASGARTVMAVRLLSALLLPLLPAALVLAPEVLPTVLGAEWSSIVVPFQVLLLVGIGHAVVNCIGEALSGIGEIAFRAKVNLVWSAATLVAVLGLVELDGIRGAALAHLVVFAPYALVYATVGARRAGTSAGELWGAIRPIVVAVGTQALGTTVVTAGLNAAGASALAAGAWGALVGIVIAGAIIVWGQPGLVRQALGLLR